ncbi:RNA 2'-phosphotransferase [Actinoplanes sp. NPDC049265]|uniref:RNA 2'-phosphotransferase n=1 Tax=Actinoplanes sp. NPDC049265 TaxID=3363902 RepID=UPI003722CB45
MTLPLTQEQVRLSRRISMVLRHRPESAGITLDSNGWVPIDTLLAALHITRAELDLVVAGNDKSRFAIEADRIRASQGHSRRVNVDLGLAPATPPARLFHGTPRANIPPIMREGLRPRTRRHVHLSPDTDTATRVGTRRSTDVAILRVDTSAMSAAGHLFYRSANGVWLTDGVPPAYLRLFT